MVKIKIMINRGEQEKHCWYTCLIHDAFLVVAIDQSYHLKGAAIFGQGLLVRWNE